MPGPQGVQGEPGPQGEPGVDGETGTLILDDYEPPEAVDGTDGDYYLDRTAQILYGPKSDAALGPEEDVIFGTPASSGGTSYRIGNTYQTVVEGLITKGHFWRQGTWATLTHRVYIYNADLSATIGVSELTTTEVAGVSGWIEVPFATPVAVAAGQIFHTVIDGDGYVYTTGNGPVLHPEYVNQTGWVFGPYGGPDAPAVGAGMYNYFIGFKWQPGIGEVWPVALRGNTTPVLTLTQAEYDVLTPDPDTLYIIIG